MTSITSVAATLPGATPTSSSPAASTAPSLDYNAFLKLLMAQMQNQDPLSPTDSTQWVSQLATFSSVEQSIQANAKLDQILQDSSVSEAEALIGRTVTSADGSVSGSVVSVALASSGPVATLSDGSTLPMTSGVVVSQ